MLLRNVDVRAVHTALELSPEALNRVRVDGAAHVLLGSVVDGAVSVTFFGERPERLGFVRRDPRAGDDDLLDLRNDRIFTPVGGSFR